MMFNNLGLAIVGLIASISAAWAVCTAGGSCFWNPLSVTGAVANGTTAKCELTVGPVATNGLQVGDTVVVSGIGGATGCNGTDTIASFNGANPVLTTLVPGGAFSSNGCLYGGHVTASNIANWASSSTSTCGSGGTAVPSTGSATATFDANSGASGSKILVDMNWAITSITCGAYTGTLDWSVSNPTVTLATSFSCTGIGTRTVKTGTGQWTLSGNSGTLWDTGTTTNATFTFNTTPIAFTGAGSGGARTMNTGGQSFGNVTVSAYSSINNVSCFALAQNNATFASFTINGPGCLQSNGTQTVNFTNFTVTNSSAFPVLLQSATVGSQTTWAMTNAPTITKAALFNINFTTAAGQTATNSYNLGGTSGITITPPASGGGGYVVSN